MAFFFISHASEDRPAAEDLHARLHSWGFSSVFLDVHPTDGLSVGTHWERDLYTEMRSANAMIFIGSVASVGSQWCFAELTLARFCGKSIFPLWLEGSRQTPLLDDHQWLDVSAGDEAYERLRHAINDRFGPRAGFFWDRNRSPYPGLKAFEPEDAAMFFGRDHKVSEVMRHLDQSRLHGGVVAVLGPSGSGKSSLVRAGVVPRLRQATDRWVVPSPFTPGERPMAALSRSLASALSAAGRSVDRRDLQRRLEKDSREFVECILDIGAMKSGTIRSVVLIVDQAEELLSISDPEERDQFLAALRMATRENSALQVVTTLRSEVLGTALYEGALADLIDETVLLGPMDRSLIPEVIEGPARIAGLEFEPGLAARMVDDTRGGDALPLLAYVLRQLTTEGAADDGVITHQEYETAGGVLGALERSADTAARQLKTGGGEDAVLSMLLRLVTLDPNGEPARRPVRRYELNAVEIVVVNAFVQARLLTSDGTTVEVAHEALLRIWPPLRRAIAASRDWLRIQADLERLSRDWDDAGRGDGYLLRDERLQTVRAALARVVDGQELRGLAGEYYAASTALERRATAAARGNRRRTRIAIVSVIALLAGLVALLGVQNNIARNQTDLANSSGLAAHAMAVSESNLDVGMLLAVEAWRAADTVEARSAALAMIHRSEGIEAQLRNPNNGQISAVAMSPNAPLLAAGGQDGVIRLWDLATRRLRGELTIPPSSHSNRFGREVTLLRFSPDGSHLAAFGGQGLVLWTLGLDGKPSSQSLLGYRFSMVQISFSSDSKILAAITGVGRIDMWDTNTGAELPSIKPQEEIQLAEETPPNFLDPHTLVTFHGGMPPENTGILFKWKLGHDRPTSFRTLSTGPVYASAITPDGSKLVTLGDAGMLTIWDAGTGQSLGEVHLPNADVTAELVVDPTGNHLAVFTDDSHIKLVDLATLKLSANQPPQVTAVGVGFNGDGRTLAIGGFGLVTVWNVEHPTELRSLLGQPSVSAEVAALDDLTQSVGMGTAQQPTQLVAISQGTLRTWDGSNTRPTQQPVDYPLGAAAISGDGQVVAMANGDGVLTTVRPGGSQPPLRFECACSTSLALSTDGSMLAAATGRRDSQEIRLWDTQTGAALGPPAHADGFDVGVLAFNPHGDILASGDYPKGIQLWRVVTSNDGLKRLEPFPRTLAGHTGAITEIAFSPSGDRLVSAGYDNTIRLWDVTTGEAIGEPIVPAARPDGVAFSHDGRTIAAVERTPEKDLLELWDAESNRKLGDTLTVASRQFRSSLSSFAMVAFSANGQSLATIDHSGAVSVWNPLVWSADRAAVSQHLCAIASRNLTRNELHQYMPNATYNRTCGQWPGDE